MSDENRMELLGQKFPLDRWFFGCLFILLLFLAFLEVYTGKGSASEFVVRVAGSYDDSGSPIVSKDLVAYRFWTPAEDTWEHTSKEDKADLIKKGREKWYKTTNEVLVKFAQDLVDNRGNTGYQGYNRVYSWGQGTSGLKPGWMWNVTFLKSNGFSIEDLTKMYSRYFYRDKHIYIEKEIISGARYQRDK